MLISPPLHNKIALQFYETPARKVLARLPREFLASGQACEAGERRCRFFKRKFLYYLSAIIL